MDKIKVNGVECGQYTKDAFKGRLVNVAGTFPGPSWDVASNAMIYKGNGLYEYTPIFYVTKEPEILDNFRNLFL